MFYFFLVETWHKKLGNMDKIVGISFFFGVFRMENRKNRNFPCSALFCDESLIELENVWFEISHSNGEFSSLIGALFTISIGWTKKNDI